MLLKLKNILNSLNDEELERLDLYVNSEFKVESIILDIYSIDLVTDDFNVKVEKE